MHYYLLFVVFIFYYIILLLLYIIIIFFFFENIYIYINYYTALTLNTIQQTPLMIILASAVIVAARHTVTAAGLSFSF